MFITLLLSKDSVISQPVLYLSLYFKRNRDRYYQLLQKVRDDGDWESFVNLFLTGVYEVSEDAIDSAQRGATPLDHVDGKSRPHHQR